MICKIFLIIRFKNALVFKHVNRLLFFLGIKSESESHLLECVCATNQNMIRKYTLYKNVEQLRQIKLKWTSVPTKTLF